MYTIKTTFLVAFVGLIHFSFSTTKTANHTTVLLEKIEAFNQELCAAYNLGENLIIVDKNGKEYLNPNKADLLNLSPDLFNENRIRVSLDGKSDNSKCSTELVIMDNTGRIEKNYSVNSCSSVAWIFFTKANCFDIALYHDAGLEAPFGRSINGSVDWSFQFNQTTRISGTYMDMGAANMFKVASPCYNKQSFNPTDAISASKVVRRGNLGL